MRALKRVSDVVKLISVCYLFILAVMIEGNNISMRLALIQALIIAFIDLLLELTVAGISSRAKRRHK